MVKAGEIAKAKVLEVDVARKRIALTRRRDDPVGEGLGGEHDGRRPGDAPRGSGRGHNDSRGGRPGNNHDRAKGPAGNNALDNALAEAFAKARGK